MFMPSAASHEEECLCETHQRRDLCEPFIRKMRDICLVGERNVFVTQYTSILKFLCEIDERAIEWTSGQLSGGSDLASALLCFVSVSIKAQALDVGRGSKREDGQAPQTVHCAYDRVGRRARDHGWNL
ncbi:hypothetical protein RB195_022810 [Necator americanus]|uniref:Uncharacterized protein n=1 Tax=Necator americanus TaxID=51031 RepID=A0ABR1EGW5_NECAM